MINELSTMVECFERAGVNQVLQELRRPTQQQHHQIDDATLSRENTGNGLVPFMWNGAFHLVPEDFTLPNCDMATAWQLWCCGYLSRGYPPYRKLTPSDMANSNVGKRLCDFRFLMNVLEDKARANNIWNPTAIIVQANQIFQSVKSVLVLDAQSEKNRKRRADQIKWSTMVNCTIFTTLSFTEAYMS